MALDHGGKSQASGQGALEHLYLDPKVDGLHLGELVYSLCFLKRGVGTRQFAPGAAGDVEKDG